ncbi:MAG: hypothetical protein OEY59_02080 [Deltaproteobacteria bacterium]|nr:hypothetical protein [Deltaproteobacteria bacterium]
MNLDNIIEVMRKTNCDLFDSLSQFPSQAKTIGSISRLVETLTEKGVVNHKDFRLSKKCHDCTLFCSTCCNFTQANSL